MSLFNTVVSPVLFSLKIAAIVLAVMGGFSAIRMTHRNPILGCLYISMVLSAVIIYIGQFQFAYKVTEKVEKLMEVMEVRSAGLVNLSEKKYWKRRLRSIPRMGMKSGGFSLVERQAVPIFIGFAINQIVSLLLAFK